MSLDTDELLETCDRLKDIFAKRASKYDAEASFPVENYEDLRKEGMMGMMVPESHGGMGANFYQYTRAAGRYAQGCASTAVSFNMHNIVIGALAEADLSAVEGRFGEIMKKFQSWAFAEAMDGKVFGAALTEPNVGFHPGSLSTTYKKVDGGFILNGKKSFVSMSGHADYYVVAAVPEVQPGGEVPVVSWLVIPKDDPGIEIEEMWNTMGMRGTVSNNMKLNEIFVPRNRLFLGFEGLVLQKLATEPHFVVGGFTACYFGVIEAIYNFTIEHQKRRKMAGKETPLIDSEMIQTRMGEMSVKVEAARQLVYHAARMVVTDRGSKETNAAIHRAKFYVGEIGPEIASMAVRACGGGTISKHLPMERYYRDIRCCGLMPAKSDECLWYVGKEAFGVDVNKPSETYW